MSCDNVSLVYYIDARQVLWFILFWWERRTTILTVTVAGEKEF